jgi:hypothetical protein
VRRREPSFTAAEVAERDRLAGGRDAGPNAALDARINLALGEIDKAWRHNRAQAGPGVDPSEVLLVYLGPEWYFRRPDRPYTREERDHAMSIFAAASKLYPGMLIMPGTLISADYAAGAFDKLTNTGFAVYDGRIVKQIDKSQDAGDTTGLVGGQAFGGAPAGQSSIFSVENLRIAMDICADHDTARTLKELQSTHGVDALSAGHGVDIHLVAAAGHSPTTTKLGTRIGGFNIGANTRERAGDTSFSQTEALGAKVKEELPVSAELTVIDRPEPTPAEVTQMYAAFDVPTRARMVRGKYHPAQTSYYGARRFAVNARTGAPLGAV